MKQLGTEEWGNRDGFKIVCQNCGREVDIIDTHFFGKYTDYKNPDKITLSIRCICGNEYGACIHSK